MSAWQPIVRSLVAAIDRHIFAPSTRTEMEETISYLKLRVALHEAQLALAESDAILLPNDNGEHGT